MPKRKSASKQLTYHVSPAVNADTLSPFTVKGLEVSLVAGARASLPLPSEDLGY